MSSEVTAVLNSASRPSACICPLTLYLVSTPEIADELPPETAPEERKLAQPDAEDSGGEGDGGDAASAAE